MATLGESPSAKILREALATVRRDALPIQSTVRLAPENNPTTLIAATDDFVEQHVDAKGTVWPLGAHH